jgi:hypothetical protein
MGVTKEAIPDNSNPVTGEEGDEYVIENKGA